MDAVVFAPLVKLPLALLVPALKVPNAPGTGLGGTFRFPALSFGLPNVKLAFGSGLWDGSVDCWNSNLRGEAAMLACSAPGLVDELAGPSTDGVGNTNGAGSAVVALEVTLAALSGRACGCASPDVFWCASLPKENSCRRASVDPSVDCAAEALCCWENADKVDPAG